MAINRRNVETVTVEARGFDELQREYRQLDQAQDRLRQGTNQADSAARKQAGGMRGLGTAMAGATAATNRQRQAVRNLGQAFAGIGGAAMTAQIAIQAVAGAMRMIKAPVDLAKDFEKEFAMIRTLNYDIGETLRTDLLSLARRVPQSISDISSSAYQAISAGISVDMTPEFLKAASDVATGAASSMTEAVEVLASAVNAFGRQGMTAAKAADILFATQRQGVTTVKQLGAQFGYVAPLAQFGVSMEEATAAVAAMTKLGMSTADAVVRLTGAVNTLAKPTKATQKRMTDLGLKFGIANMRAKGFAGVLAELQEKTGGSAAAIGGLTRRIEGTQGMLSLTGPQFEIFNKILDGNKNSATEASKAFKTLDNTTEGTLNRFKALSEDVLRRMGEETLPYVVDALNRFMDYLNEEGDNLKETFGEAFKMFYEFAKFVLQNGDRIAAAMTGMFAGGALISFGTNLAAASATIAATAGTGMATTLAGALAAGLSGVGWVALLAGVGYVIVDAIGDTMKERALERTQDVVDTIRKGLEEVDKQIVDRAKKAGTASPEQAEQAQRALLAGKRIPLGDITLDAAQGLAARKQAGSELLRRTKKARRDGVDADIIRAIAEEGVAGLSPEDIAELAGARPMTVRAGQIKDQLTPSSAFSRDPVLTQDKALELSQALKDSADSYAKAADQVDELARQAETAARTLHDSIPQARDDVIAEIAAFNERGGDPGSAEARRLQEKLRQSDPANIRGRRVNYEGQIASAEIVQELEVQKANLAQLRDAARTLRESAENRKKASEDVVEAIKNERETATNVAENEKRTREAEKANKAAAKANKAAASARKKAARDREMEERRIASERRKLTEDIIKAQADAERKAEIESETDGIERKIKAMEEADKKIVEGLRRRAEKIKAGQGATEDIDVVEVSLEATTYRKAQELRDKEARKRAEQEAKAAQLRAADAQKLKQEMDFRRLEIYGSSLDMELARLDAAHQAEKDKFRGHQDFLTELTRYHEEERARIRQEHMFQHVHEAFNTGEAIGGSIMTIMGSYNQLAQARVRSAQAQVRAGKMTEEQAKKEQQAAFRMQEQMIVADGVMHAFKGLGQQALAAEKFATGFIPQGIAHQMAAVAHFAQAANASRMAGYARTANEAGLSASGGGGGGGGASGPGGFRTDSGSSALTADRSTGPAIQFGDIVLSDVPALLSRDGLNALGSQIADTVAREINNNTNTPGGARISRRAMRR